MNTHYFTKDGNYGDADGATMFDTTKWTAAQWQAIEDASNQNRFEVAKEIAKFTTLVVAQ